MTLMGSRRIRANESHFGTDELSGRCPGRFRYTHVFKESTMNVGICGIDVSVIQGSSCKRTSGSKMGEEVTDGGNSFGLAEPRQKNNSVRRCRQTKKILNRSFMYHIVAVPRGKPSTNAPMWRGQFCGDGFMEPHRGRSAEFCSSESHIKENIFIFLRACCILPYRTKRSGDLEIMANCLNNVFDFGVVKLQSDRKMESLLIM